MARPKRSVSAADRLSGKHCDPLGYLIEQFHQNPTIELALELLPYQCPKLKAVEHTGEIGTRITVVIGGLDDA